MSGVIAVSKQGVNVGTATDPNDFIFYSSYNTFKILKEGFGTIVAGSATNGTTTIAHNLGTTYPYYAYATIPGQTFVQHVGGIFITNVTIGTDSVVRGQIQNFDGMCGTSNIVFTNFQTLVATGTTIIKYYIFARP